jgi:acyl carrier protein
MKSMNDVLPRMLALDAGVAAGLSEQTRLMEDLGMTSATTLELFLELEDALDIQIDTEGMTPADVATLGALAEFISGHVVEDED